MKARGRGQRLVILLGGLLAFFYFRFIDTAAGVPPIGGGEIVFSAVAFGVIALAVTVISTRWIPYLFAGAASSTASSPSPRCRRYG